LGLRLGFFDYFGAQCAPTFSFPPPAGGEGDWARAGSPCYRYILLVGGASLNFHGGRCPPYMY
jgi:hypothetical protein